jgi:uncharacterized damage-inducible protein DinB
MTPEQGTFLLNFLLPTIEREYQTTLKMLRAIPPGKDDYRPAENSMTTLDLAWHLTIARLGFLRSIAAGEFQMQPPPKPSTVEEVIQFGEEKFREGVAAVKQLSPEQLVKIIDFRGMVQMPAVAFLQMALVHEVHHRGQLSVYLRPMGAKVPSIYGESFDDKQARMATAAQN